MTDLALDDDNDLLVFNGQLVLLTKVEEVVRQRIMISLKTSTNTWFENKNFGINADLLFTKGTKELLDQDIKTIVSETAGVIRVLSFVSNVDKSSRIYRCNFVYETETGEITSITNVTFGNAGLLSTTGIFVNGVWNYDGIWTDEFIWPE